MAFPCSLRGHFDLSPPLGTVQTRRVCGADLSIPAPLTATHTGVGNHTVPLKVLHHQTPAGSPSLLRLHPSHPPHGLQPYGPFAPWLCSNHYLLGLLGAPAGSPAIQYWLALSRGLSLCSTSTQHSYHRHILSWKRCHGWQKGILKVTVLKLERSQCWLKFWVCFLFYHLCQVHSFFFFYAKCYSSVRWEFRPWPHMLGLFCFESRSCWTWTHGPLASEGFDEN